MKTKFSSRKLVASLLLAILSLSIVGANIFGALNAELYSGYIQGNTILGETQTLTDPAARDLYNDLIFVSGAPGSASASGYGSFYTYRSYTGAYAYEFGYANPVAGGDGLIHILYEFKPIGNFQCEFRDGSLAVSNTWTGGEVRAQIKRDVNESQQHSQRQSLSK